MGEIRELIKKNVDTGEDAVSEQNTLIETLALLAETKAELLKAQILQKLNNSGSGADKSFIPITQILDFKMECHAYSETKVTLIADSVGKAVKEFIQGGGENIIDGITGLLSTSITALLASSNGSEDELEEMYIALEGLSLVRLDVLGWKKKIEGTGLTDKVEQISAFVMSKSVIDMEKLDYNSFLNKYQLVIKENDNQAKSLDIIKEARSLFNAFKEN